MLVMLSEIYDALKLDSGVNTALLREAVYSGHSWALEWDMAGLTQVEETPRQVVTEVVDILDMHSFLEAGFKALTAEEQAQIEWPHRVEFNGFDGNNEIQHMSVARMLLEHMERWQEFKGRPLNSHSETLHTKARMVEAFEPIRRTLVDRKMTVDEIKTVLGG